MTEKQHRETQTQEALGGGGDQNPMGIGWKRGLSERAGIGSLATARSSR